MKILYLSYDGMLEPLGQSQVLTYLEKLSKDHGHHITLISFEKPADLTHHSELNAVQKRVDAANICWIRRTYHKRPTLPATAWDCWVGVLSGILLTRRNRIDLIHARSYVAGAMAFAISRVCGKPWIFDMRGFWADEKVEGGSWPKGSVLYRFTKKIEKLLLNSAQHIISLTQAAVPEIARIVPEINPKRIDVIPTCVDLDRFKGKKVANHPHPKIGYIGSADHWYDFELTAKCIAILMEKDPLMTLVVVNKKQHELIRAQLIRHRISPDRFSIREATHTEIPGILSTIDASLFFIKPTFSKKASAPTRWAELLSFGIPCLTGPQIGDTDQLMLTSQTGVICAQPDTESLRVAADQLLKLMKDEKTAERCRRLAESHFSVQSACAKIDRIYRNLTHT